MSGQVSCPVSAFAGDGQSILPNFFSVFIDCGLALGSAHSSEPGQGQHPSPKGHGSTSSALQHVVPQWWCSQAEEYVVFASLAGNDFPGSREEPCPGLRYCYTAEFQTWEALCS